MSGLTVLGIDLLEAFTLPFKKEYRRNLFLIGSAAVFATFLVSGMSNFVGQIFSSLFSALGEDKAALAIVGLVVVVLVSVLNGVINFLAQSFPLGYLWRLSAHFQDPENTPQPDWIEDAFGIWKDGMKLSIYQGVVIGIPVGLVMTVLILVFGIGAFASLKDLAGVDHPSKEQVFQVLKALAITIIPAFTVYGVSYIFLGPFFIAPMIYSATERTWGSLFNLPKAWGQAVRFYPKAVVGQLLVIVFSLVYFVAFGISLITVFGFIMLIFPCQAGTWYIWTKALSDDSRPANTSGSSERPQLIS